MKTFIMVLALGAWMAATGCCTRSNHSSDSGLVVLRAMYGVEPNRTVDVTDEIRSLAKSGSIQLHPQWGLGVDPAYGAIKWLTVAYQYNGRVEVVSVSQWEELQIPVGVHLRAPLIN